MEGGRIYKKEKIEYTHRNTDAVVTYNSVEDLTGRRSFQCILGVQTISLALENQVAIAGSLTEPVIPVQVINGSGIWVVASS